VNIEKVNALLRLAQKGRMLEIGATAAAVSIKRKRAALILIAIDASEKIKRELELECRRYNIPLYIFSNKTELGKICGRESVAVITVSDRNLARGIKENLL